MLKRSSSSHEKRWKSAKWRANRIIRCPCVNIVTASWIKRTRSSMSNERNQQAAFCFFGVIIPILKYLLGSFSWIFNNSLLNILPFEGDSFLTKIIFQLSRLTPESLSFMENILFWNLNHRLINLFSVIYW